MFQQLSYCNNDLFTSNVDGVSIAKVFRDNILINQVESCGDKEVDAHFIYHLPKNERGINESYEFAESKAWGKWIYEKQSNKLMIYSRNLAVPGLRWPFGRDTVKRNFAPVRANMQNEISLSFMNRLSEVKTLSAKMTIAFNTSVVTGFIPPHQYLDFFEIQTSDNKITTIPVLWNIGDNFIEFDICSLKPGETVKVKIGRTLKSKAIHDDSYAISEDITIKFLLTEPS